MSVTFAAIRVGEPIRHKTLAVFPLFAERGSDVDYLLSKGDTLMDFSLEAISARHAHAVVDIFNYFIANSMAAYAEEPVSHEFFDRFRQMRQGYPAFVATDSTGRVVGFGFLRPFHFASSIRRTAEVTYFILPEFTRQGVGTTLLNRLIEQAVPMGIDNLVANVSSKNEDSLAFHRKNGFSECGRIRQAGRKCGQDFDIVWMQRHLLP